MLQSLSILPKRWAMILSASASTGKAGVPAVRLLYGSIFTGLGSVFADYRYYPNQVVYHKVLDALEAYSGKCKEKSR